MGKGVMDRVLMVVDWLNIVLIIVCMIQSTMCFVISMVLDIVMAFCMMANNWLFIVVDRLTTVMVRHTVLNLLNLIDRITLMDGLMVYWLMAICFMAYGRLVVDSLMMLSWLMVGRHAMDRLMAVGFMADDRLVVDWYTKIGLVMNGLVVNGLVVHGQVVHGLVKLLSMNRLRMIGWFKMVSLRNVMDILMDFFMMRHHVILMIHAVQSCLMNIVSMIKLLQTLDMSLVMRVWMSCFVVKRSVSWNETCVLG